MRPKTTRQKTYCPHCRAFKYHDITAEAARRTKGGFPFLTCFDCLNRRAKPTEGRLSMNDLLTGVLQAVKARGLQGIVLCTHGNGPTPYLAMCLQFDGSPCDPRNYAHQATPEAALADLAKRLRPEVEEPTPLAHQETHA